MRLLIPVGLLLPLAAPAEEDDSHLHTVEDVRGPFDALATLVTIHQTS